MRRRAHDGRLVPFQLRDAPRFLLGLVGVDLGRRLELGHAPPQRASRDLLRLVGLVAGLGQGRELGLQGGAPLVRGVALVVELLRFRL